MRFQQNPTVLVRTLVITLLMIPLDGSAAQDRSTVFLFRPGMLTADFVSAPPGISATTGFNLRFEARFPTRLRWLTPVLGASVTPYGTSGVNPRSANAPVLFTGNIFPLLAARRTAGWLEIELPVLLMYSYGGGGAHNSKLYGRDLVIEMAVSFPVGAKLLRPLSRTFAGWQAYVLLEQNLTPNADPSTGHTDRFNPVAVYGLTIPLAGAASP